LSVFSTHMFTPLFVFFVIFENVKFTLFLQS
jgi:hypothetical protein